MAKSNSNGYMQLLTGKLDDGWKSDSLIEISEFQTQTNFGNRVGADPNKFGFIIWDIDGRFKKRLRTYKTSNEYVDNNVKANYDNDNSFGIPLNIVCISSSGIGECVPNAGSTSVKLSL